MEEEKKLVNEVEYDFIRPLEGETVDEYIERIIQTRGKYNIPNDWYYENHHILPRCLGGEPEVWNHKTKHENMIWLLPEEHFIAHALWCIKIPHHKELLASAYALNNHRHIAFNNPDELLLSAETYGMLKRDFSESMSGENNPNYGGIYYTEESRRKMSEAAKRQMAELGHPMQGKHHSEETKKKISETLTGLLVGEKNGFYGKHHTEEYKKKASEYWTGRMVDDKNPRAVAVVCIETGVIFLCLKEARAKTEASERVSQCCRDGKTSGGYHWRYATPEEIEQEKERRKKEVEEKENV